MKTLVFVTSQFPFGPGETFIGSEFPFLAQSFDKILIIAQNTSYIKSRNVSTNTIIKRYNTSTSITGYLLMPFLFCTNLKSFYRLYREELSFRRSAGFTLKTDHRRILLKKIVKAIQLRDFIKETLKKEKIKENIVFYSYWLKSGAHAISMLNFRNSIKFSRAHGSDIYEEKTKEGYLPLLRYSAENLDAIFFISDNGKTYFEKKTGFSSPSFLVSYLGTDKPETNFYPSPLTDRFLIVSCSNLIPLKRIDLIIYALRDIKTEKNIEWIHFGDGILRHDLEKMAGSVLLDSKKIQYKFMGHFQNADLIQYYGTNFIDLFINTSSSEGLPVSIMEAQSFGIPVIATDTGGVKEIVKEGTGSLLPVDFRPEDLARLIQHYSTLPENEIEIIRNNAKQNWAANFKSGSNYMDFLKKVNIILATAK